MGYIKKIQKLFSTIHWCIGGIKILYKRGSIYSRETLRLGGFGISWLAKIPTLYRDWLRSFN